MKKETLYSLLYNMVAVVKKDIGVQIVIWSLLAGACLGLTQVNFSEFLTGISINSPLLSQLLTWSKKIFFASFLVCILPIICLAYLNFSTLDDEYDEKKYYKISSKVLYILFLVMFYLILVYITSILFVLILNNSKNGVWSFILSWIITICVWFWAYALMRLHNIDILEVP